MQKSNNHTKTVKGSSISKSLLHTIAKRFKVYLVVNTASIVISLIALGLCTLAKTQVHEALAVFLSSEIRMFLAIANSLAIIKRHKEHSGEDRDIFRPVLNMLTFVGVVEISQYFYLTRYFKLIDMALPASLWGYAVEYLTFVPKSLYIELVMDFFHYWMHRYAHKNKFLFRFAHADHHKDHHPTPWTTYDQSITDVILTNMFPVLVSLLMGPRLTIFQWHLLLTYKTLVEVNGHNGVPSRGKSFPQFPLLGFCTNMCLDAEDHHEHHRVLIGNYSKRFRFWDDVFGTYKSPKSKSTSSRTESNTMKTNHIPECDVRVAAAA